jgi:hypothetical protein
MAGERLQVANLGWHSLNGDRRLAFRRIDYRSGNAVANSKQASRRSLATRRKYHGIK